MCLSVEILDMRTRDLLAWHSRPDDDDDDCGDGDSGKKDQLARMVHNSQVQFD